MNSNDLAPIVLFVYNRPVHTRKTLNSLLANELAAQSHLYIYSDGPKPDATKENLKKIQEVRQLIREKQWCKNVTITESKKNKGLPNYLPETVTKIVNQYGKIIVLEDDLVLSGGFLKFMNDALELYKDEEKVMHISGFVFPVKRKLPETFFLKLMNPWGWGTWSKAWQNFNNDSAYMLKLIENSNKIHQFNFEGNYDFYQLLQGNHWDVRWYASIFLQNGFCLFPHTSLVKNIGFDNSGVHWHELNFVDNQPIADNIKVLSVPIEESSAAKMEMEKINLILSHKDFLSRLKNVIRQISPPILYKFLRNTKLPVTTI